jgi:hypothetical protein
MNDEQWLNAIATYESDEGNQTTKDFLKGGAWQLSRSSRLEPKRNQNDSRAQPFVLRGMRTGPI